MKTNGYLLCDGNLFYHESTFIKAEIIDFTCGSKLAIFCIDAEGFAAVHKKLVSIFRDEFSICTKKGLKQGQDQYELYFSLLGNAKDKFSIISKEITEHKSESKFVEVY